ncbi:hypothetical protein AJ79_08683 [Helicocarpus griseus UAMH5409]|uniref:Uncharacterized protein n=1 Tax=Helicocarpus griseus UAMH5409 TaxID=1447875 RepID=A0A2B7WRC2_9EURO|nr:hypothetical protein AJ79_08683 [Helicocarpus griseus UAMH5409]
MTTITTHHITTEEGKEMLKKLQDAFSTGKAVVEKTESDGNVRYKNESLRGYVLPLLENLKLRA